MEEGITHYYEHENLGDSVPEEYCRYVQINKISI